MLFARHPIYKLGCLLIGLLAATPYLAQQPAKDRIVSLTVTVTDGDLRFVGGLERDRFSLFEKKTPLEITSFSNDDSPLSIAILLDLSGSQTGKQVETANWVGHFIASGNPANEYLIVGFNKGSRILCDWGCHEKELLASLNAASRAELKNGTALYQATDLALKEMVRSSHSRQSIVLLSDGLDNLSKITFQQLRRSLKESKVMVYSVGIRSAERSIQDLEGQAVLDELARVTGGEALFPRSRQELMESAEHIALELRHQYLFTFKATGPPDQELHKIKVKLTPPEVKRGNKTVHLRLRYKEEFDAQ